MVVEIVFFSVVEIVSGCKVAFVSHWKKTVIRPITDVLNSWLNLKLKREQEMKRFLSCCCLHMIDCKRAKNNTNAAFHQRPDCEKQDHLESSVCPPSRHKLCRFFLTSNVYRGCMLFVMKKFYNFPKKSELLTFILRVKISWHFFLQFPGWK